MLSVALLACGPDPRGDAVGGESSGGVGTGGTASSVSTPGEVDSTGGDTPDSTGSTSSEGSTGDGASSSTGAAAQWCASEDLLVSGEFQFAGGTEVLRLGGQLYLYRFRGSATGFTFNRDRVEDGVPVPEIELVTNGTGYVRDFNGDGLLDLWTSGNILVEGSEIRFGTAGAEAFGEPVAVDQDELIVPRLIALADFDGDGAIDIMSHASSWSTVYIGLSNGSGEYWPDLEGPGPANLSGGGVAHAATALDDPTRIVIDYGDWDEMWEGQLVMHRIEGSSIVTEAAGPEGYRGRVLDVHDDDGDGLTEAYCLVDGSLVHVEANARGGLDTTELWPTHAHTFARDFDGDGDVDLLRWAAASTVLFHERTAGGFEEGVPVDIGPLPEQPRVSPLRDYDFDGDGDLIVAIPDGGETEVFALSVQRCSP